MLTPTMRLHMSGACLACSVSACCFSLVVGGDPLRGAILGTMIYFVIVVLSLPSKVHAIECCKTLPGFEKNKKINKTKAPAHTFAVPTIMFVIMLWRDGLVYVQPTSPPALSSAFTKGAQATDKRHCRHLQRVVRRRILGSGNHKKFLESFGYIYLDLMGSFLFSVIPYFATNGHDFHDKHHDPYVRRCNWHLSGSKCSGE